LTRKFDAFASLSARRAQRGPRRAISILSRA